MLVFWTIPNGSTQYSTATTNHETQKGTNTRLKILHNKGKWF